jgi:DedD protein
MNDHNLDDLIIDEIEPAQSNKAKSFLTIVALAIVILIVSIIFTKIMLKAPEEEQLLFEQNETELISPDLTLQSVPEPEETSSEPIETPEETNTLKIAEEIPAPEEKVKEIQEEPQEEKVEQSPEKAEKPADAAAPKPVETESIPTPAPMPKAVEEKSTDILNISEEPVKTPEKQSTKVPPQKAHKAPTSLREEAVQTHRPANVITRPHETHRQYTSRGNYYIQVGAFKKTPSKRFLDRITRSGFAYTITKRSPRGLKKLLIGPYSDKKSAERALARVKDLISKRAFLLKKR